MQIAYLFKSIAQKLLLGTLLFVCFFPIGGINVFAQTATPSMSGIASALGQANGNTQNSSSIEAPLLTGNLGRGIDANNLNGSGKEGINSNTSIEGLTNSSKQGQLRNFTNQVGSGDPKPEVNNLVLPPLVPTQFQEFVKDTTGKSLQLYGYNLFEGYRFTSLADVPVPANYVIGPGDEIDLKLWGMTDNMLRIPIDRNGQMSIPKVGTINLAGTRADQLEDVLRSHLSKVFKKFELSASVGRLRSIQIFVVGQARKPGAYMVSSMSTLIAALFESGGPSSNGSLRKIKLIRGGQLVTTLDLYSFIHSGDTSKDSRLLPGDVIVIPPVENRVALYGATDNPAIYELSNTEETVSQLLKYAGGQSNLSTPHKVQLERVDAQKIKGPRLVLSLALNEAGLSYRLKNSDVLTLFKISPEFGNAVTLRGNVASPLRYPYKQGMRIADLIPETDALIQADYYARKNKFVQYESGLVVSAERVIGETRGLLEEINWSYATLERTDNKEVKTILIPFDLGKAIRQNDPRENHELQPGDVITVFGVKDLPVPLENRTQFVKVLGEVKVPGIYQLNGNETLNQAIEKAGGLTKNAYLFGTVFTRESARVQQQENLSKAIRRMQADIVNQSATLLQNITDSEKGQSTQAQIASQKLLIERAQTIKANGRVSLEMTLGQPVLPDISIEDGDTIYVPNKPSFVGVYGAVLAEASLMHRTTYSVTDYLDKSGLSRDADIDEILIIRADGSVEGNPKGLRKKLTTQSLASKTLQPGDTVFVPEIIDRRGAYTQFIQGVKDWTQIVFQMGIGAVALKTLRQ